MNKKTIIILLLFILLISICTVLVVNGMPELTEDWTTQSRAIFKQYVKVIGFLSVMGLVYLRLRKSKEKNLEEEYIDDQVEEDFEIKK